MATTAITPIRSLLRVAEDVTYKLKEKKLPTLKKSKESSRHIAFSATLYLFPPTTQLSKTFLYI